jgi:hypothetical protein
MGATGVYTMSSLLKAVLILVASAGPLVGYVFYESALSPDNWIYQGGSPTNWKDGGLHGAPGPIAGAGLPVIAIGYGVYLLVKRRRRAN